MRRKSTKAPRLIGHSFSNNTAVVILRSTGQVLNRVTVLERSFLVETPDLGVLDVPTKNIKTISTEPCLTVA